MSQTDAVAEACRVWQSGRERSTGIRAAARRMTGTSHYFDADWLRELEDRAEADEPMRRHARALMDAVAASEPTDAAGWCRRAGVPGAFVGRGLMEKPREDEQILASLRTGRLTMPLWGVSLSEDVARGYGDHWLFVIEGPFHGIAAWQHSGIKDLERELIIGGRYEVLDAEELVEPPARVRLRELEPVRPAPSHPPSTWSVERPFDFDYLDRPVPRYEDD